MICMFKHFFLRFFWNISWERKANFLNKKTSNQMPGVKPRRTEARGREIIPSPCLLRIWGTRCEHRGKEKGDLISPQHGLNTSPGWAPWLTRGSYLVTVIWPLHHEGQKVNVTAQSLQQKCRVMYCSLSIFPLCTFFYFTFIRHT